MGPTRARTRIRRRPAPAPAAPVAAKVAPQSPEPGARRGMQATAITDSASPAIT